MKHTHWLLIALVLYCISCSRIRRMGFYDREEYLRYQQFPEKRCEQVNDFFDSLEVQHWKNDRLGELGDRKKILERKAEAIKKGVLNGISLSCLRSLLGQANKSYWDLPEDTVFQYHIYQNKDTSISLHFSYDFVFEKLIDTRLYYHYSRPPFTQAPCSQAFIERIDNAIAEIEYKRLPSSPDLSKSEAFMQVFTKNKSLVIGESMACLRRYLGEADDYSLFFENGIWGEETDYTAHYDKISFYDYTFILSRNDSRIVSFKEEPGAIP
ncbi:MAG: hypothetical protein R8P61_04860 [Bacteroidia bacterium]|nr:hypothetical protein [Bacteroidia bacterium]